MQEIVKLHYSTIPKGPSSYASITTDYAWLTNQHPMIVHVSDWAPHLCSHSSPILSARMVDQAHYRTSYYAARTASAGGLTSACLSACEEGLVVSRVHVCLLARKGWWSRECVFVCSRGRAGGLASACLIPL